MMERRISLISPSRAVYTRMTSCLMLCWLFHLQTGGHKGDIVWTLHEFITATILPYRKWSPWKNRSKRAEGNVLASKTYAHLGCQRLARNILPVAATASRHARCRSVKETQCVTYDVGDWGNWDRYLSVCLAWFSHSFCLCRFLPLDNCQLHDIPNTSWFVN